MTINFQNLFGQVDLFNDTILQFQTLDNNVYVVLN